ncbi:CST complex subunit Ten1 [Staphylotrichum tortipilum]|uniref:CST complex subunit Ten1 n=1 Tax=Staphylotrichum tortipilum TaxID=2831512 RepID=A0AAN6RQ10_9PEZI|nr:CST complex subunit Ten1 [Staphylotrichum longicolle]
MSHGPRPSQLCLLSDLPRKQVGDKMRFLGCVESYSPMSGILTLEHRLPDETHPALALVDVKLVLESMRSDQTRKGEWVNVIGYITEIPPLADDGGLSHGGPRIHAQAVLLWSAGPVDIQRYELSVKALDQTNGVNNANSS